MKKILLIFSIALCISACSGVNTTKVTEQTDSVLVDTTLVDSITFDSI